MLTLTQFSRLFKRSNKVSLISDSIPLVLLKRPYKSNSMATRCNFSICPIAVFSHLGWWIKQWLDWLIEFPLLWLGMLIIHAHHRPQLRSLKKNRYDKMPRHTTLQTNQTQLCFFAYSYRLNEPCEFANIPAGGKIVCMQGDWLMSPFNAMSVSARMMLDPTYRSGYYAWGRYLPEHRCCSILLGGNNKAELWIISKDFLCGNNAFLFSRGRRFLCAFVTPLLRHCSCLSVCVCAYLSAVSIRSQWN